MPSRFVSLRTLNSATPSAPPALSSVSSGQAGVDFQQLCSKRLHRLSQSSAFTSMRALTVHGALGGGRSQPMHWRPEVRARAACRGRAGSSLMRLLHARAPPQPSSGRPATAAPLAPRAHGVEGPCFDSQVPMSQCSTQSSGLPKCGSSRIRRLAGSPRDPGRECRGSLRLPASRVWDNGGAGGRALGAAARRRARR